MDSGSELGKAPGYILAGGASSRFGSDKARARLTGEPLIARLARAMASHATHVTVVAEQADKYADLGLVTIPDLVPRQGPLGGLLTALSHAPAAGWVLVVACDLLELRTSWLDTLQQLRGEQHRAVLFRGDRWQPFPGLYHTALRSLIERQLRSGERALNDLISRARPVALPLPHDWPEVAQVNSVSQLERYVAALGEPPSGGG